MKTKTQNEKIGKHERSWIMTQLRCVLVLFVMTAHMRADEEAGCASPNDLPHPICGYLEEISGCVKWVHSPVPQACDGPDAGFVCFIYSTSGTVTLYHKDGNSAEECACDSSDWAQQGEPGEMSIKQAYNNDTSCTG